MSPRDAARSVIDGDGGTDRASKRCEHGHDRVAREERPVATATGMAATPRSVNSKPSSAETSTFPRPRRARARYGRACPGSASGRAGSSRLGLPGAGWPARRNLLACAARDRLAVLAEQHEVDPVPPLQPPGETARVEPTFLQPVDHSVPVRGGDQNVARLPEATSRSRDAQIFRERVLETHDTSRTV